MIIPSPAAETVAFWQAARKGQFLLRYCDTCKYWRHPRQVMCTCGQPLSWKQSQGTGKLLARTIVEYAFNPELVEQVPYTITLTKLSEGPHFLSSVSGEHISMHGGMNMKVIFDAVTSEVTMPRFVPA